MDSHKHSLWPWFTAATAAALLVLPKLPNTYSGTEFLIATVGGIWALAFYLQQRHAEDARFLKELMTEFNSRYNGLNGPLQEAIWSPTEFSKEQRLCFIDYFNLCAEEHVFWEKGYIDKKIWQAWQAGMAYYWQDPRVRKLWEEERGPSYYGFDFPC